MPVSAANSVGCNAQTITKAVLPAGEEKNEIAMLNAQRPE